MFLWHLATQQELTEALTKPFLCWYSLVFISPYSYRQEKDQKSWISLGIQQTPDWQEHPKPSLFNSNKL